MKKQITTQTSHRASLMINRAWSIAIPMLCTIIFCMTSLAANAQCIVSVPNQSLASSNVTQHGSYFTTTCAGVLASIRVDFSAAPNQTYTMKVYSGNNCSAPGTALRTTTFLNPGTGDEIIPISPDLSVTAGQTYMFLITATSGFGLRFNGGNPVPNTEYFFNTSCSTGGGDWDVEYTATITAPAVPATALDFDGSNDYVQTASNFSPGTANFTIEAWIKPSSGNGSIIWGQEFTGSATHQFRLDYIGNVMNVCFTGSTPSGPYFASTVNAAPLNTWTHTAVTRQGDVYTLYVNGVPNASMTYAGVNLTGSPYPFRIGARGSTSAQSPFQGSIDEVRVWNVARTCDEISQRRNCELMPANEVNLIAYYKFNQGIASGSNAAETILTDATTSGNSGTLNGFALTGATSNWIAPGGVATGNTCTGSITVPEINVQGNSTTIVDGDNTPSTTDHTDFGNVNTSGNSVKTYTIQNSGTGNLTVTGISMSGTEASLFTVGGISLPATVSAGSSITFTVTFAPTSFGVKTATVNIANSDCDEGTYDFAIQGTGVTQPSFSVCPSNQSANTASGQCTAAVSYTATATGSPTPTITYAFTGATTASGSGTGTGSTFNKGTTNVVITASNGVGSDATCSFTITVNDNIAPTITCAADVTINTTTGLCTGTTTLALPTTGDNCPDNLGNGLNNNNNGRITVPYNALLKPTTNITVESWWKPSAVNVGNYGSIYRSGDNLTNLYHNIPGNMIWLLFINGSYYNVIDPTPFAVGQWYHFAGTYDGSVMKLYKNGTLVGSTNITGTISTTTSTPYVAGEPGDNGKGTFDEFRLWNVTRTQAQIQSNMGSEIAAQAGLVLYYKFNQGVAGGNNAGLTFVTDASGNNFTGTLTGSFPLNGNTGNWVNGLQYPVLSNNAPATYPKGSTSVTWTATDASGNSATCTQIVTVVDNQAPTLTCFTNQTLIAANCTASYAIADPISDNCTGATWGYTLTGATTATVTGIPDGMGSGALAFNIGVTTVVLSGTDGTNSATSCTRTVTVNAPEINVQGNSVTIADGDNTPSAADHTDFGNVSTGSNVIKTYTIQNTGTGNLTVTGISMSGTDASLFTPGALTPPSPIPAGGSATFTLTFAPTTAGIKAATVHITNNDCDEVDYDFAVQGTGVVVTASTDYFRTISSGNWNAPATWQSATNAGFTTGVVSPATLSPNFNANAITIQSPHTVTVTANVTTDQTTINSGGSLVVDPNIVLVVNDGMGTDLTVNSGGSLTIRSTATGTGSIGNSAGTISGDVMLERYIPARRAWKLLTAPVRNGTSIWTNWQNNGTGDINSTTGVNIWGPTGSNPAPNASNGLNLGPNYSMKQYNAAGNSWTTIQDTKNTLLSTDNAGSAANNKSFLLFVTNPFDNLGTNITPPGSALTTLSAKGSLQQGDQTFSITAHHPTTNQYALIGNPYASPVSFSDLMLLGTNLSAIENRFWLFDATQSTLGNYQVVYYVSAGNYFMVPGTTPSGGSSAGDYVHLQSGQAVFVEPTATGGTLTFKEAYKSTPSSATPIFLVPPQSLAVNLNMGSQLLDGSLMLYDNNYAAAIVAAEDVKKVYNDGPNVAIARNNEGYIIEARPEITSKDTSFLWISNIQANQTYRFSFKADQFNPLIQAWLEDAFTNGRTAVNLSGTLNYIDFNTTSDPASRHFARFRIVYAGSGPLPISFTDVKAYQQANGQATAVKVAWTVNGELNADRYEVEYSTDGVHFSKLAIVNATGNNNGTVSYSYLHITPAAGMNYYRIKLVERSGSSKYSIIVKVDLDIKGAPGIVIYPNPLIDRQGALQLRNLPAGNYELAVYSNTGQLVSRVTISHSGGTSSRQLSLEAVTAAGVYQVQLTGPDKSRYNATLTVTGQ